MKVILKNSNLVFSKLSYVEYGVNDEDMSSFLNTLPNTNYYALYDSNLDLSKTKIYGIKVKCNAAGTLDIYTVDVNLSNKIESVVKSFNVVEGVNTLMFDSPLNVNRLTAVKTNLVAWKSEYNGMKYMECTSSDSNMCSPKTGVVPAISYLTLPM